MQLFQQSCGIKKDKRARFLAHNSKVSRCEEKLMKDVFLWLQIWPKEKGPDDKHQKMTWIHHPSSASFKITHSPKKKNFVETTNPFCPKLEGRFGAVNRNQPPIGTDLRKMPVPCYHGPFWGGVFGMPVTVVTRGKVEEVQQKPFWRWDGCPRNGNIFRMQKAMDIYEMGYVWRAWMFPAFQKHPVKSGFFVSKCRFQILSFQGISGDGDKQWKPDLTSRTYQTVKNAYPTNCAKRSKYQHGPHATP